MQYLQYLQLSDNFRPVLINLDFYKTEYRHKTLSTKTYTQRLRFR